MTRMGWPPQKWFGNIEMFQTQDDPTVTVLWRSLDIHGFLTTYVRISYQDSGQVIVHTNYL